MHPDQRIVDLWLDRAVAEFEENPLCTQLMRRLAYERSELFSMSALRYLGTEGQSSALRFMTSLVLRQKYVFDRLSDPGPAALQKAVVLFKRLIAIDPSFDVKLAKMLPDRTGVNHSAALEGSRAARAIEVLDSGSMGRRLLPVVSHLADSRDPRLCAKATLFIGRRMKSPAWAEKQLEHSNQRVRASAIESLWGLDTPQAKELMHRCVHDDCNRVAGNSLVGLHIAGEEGILDEIKDMAEAENFHFRATAAWTMGRIGDPAFLPQLTPLIRDEDPTVRGTALRSLIGMRRELARTAALIEAQGKPREPEASAEVDVEPDQPLESKLPDSSVLYVHLDGSSFASKGLGLPDRGI